MHNQRSKHQVGASLSLVTAVLMTGHVCPTLSTTFVLLLTASSQDPILLEGTVRSNLDPFLQYSDAEVAAAIERVMGCIDSIEAAATDESSRTMPVGTTAAGTAAGGTGHRRIDPDLVVTKDGNNFSAGERQLLALARAFLYNRKIIVMDEPTATIDSTTVRLLLSELSRHHHHRFFISTTIITLNTINYAAKHKQCC